MNKFYLIDNNIFYLSSLESQLRAGNRNVFPNHGDMGLGQTFKDILISQPEIIITDLILPSFNGFDLLHKLQENHYTNHIPVVVYTDLDNKHLKIRSEGKGSEHFFTKDEFSPENLITRLIKIY